MLIRIITALVLAPLALGAIYGLSAVPFALLIAAIVGLGAFEWSALVLAPNVKATEAQAMGAAERSLGNNPYTRVIVAAVFVTGCLALCAWLWLTPAAQGDWLVISMVCWGWAIIEVLIYPRQEVGRRNIRWVFFGLIVLPGAWLAMVSLRELDPHLLVLTCFLVWGADAGAYFVGKAVGARKLAPKVSPGKTWEGALGGAVIGVLIAGAFGWFFVAALQRVPLITAVVLIALVVMSVFGDLFESILKRSAGAKDSGRLLPGHGGVLDRVDALIAVLPFMAFFAAHLAYLAGHSGSP